MLQAVVSLSVHTALHCVLWLHCSTCYAREAAITILVLMLINNGTAVAHTVLLCSCACATSGIVHLSLTSRCS
jgi:hypothetical protein